MKRILLCTDNEPHTQRAEDYAIYLASSLGCKLTVIHVVDPFLKKFTNEIYAVNRDECRAHLDNELTREGHEALSRAMKKAKDVSLDVEISLKYGSPEEEILKEIGNGDYDLVIMGAKLLKNWRERFESYNISEKIFRKSPISVLFIR